MCPKLLFVWAGLEVEEMALLDCVFLSSTVDISIQSANNLETEGRLNINRL